MKKSLTTLIWSIRARPLAEVMTSRQLLSTEEPQAAASSEQRRKAADSPRICDRMRVHWGNPFKDPDSISTEPNRPSPETPLARPNAPLIRGRAVVRAGSATRPAVVAARLARIRSARVCAAVGPAGPAARA